MFVSGGFAEVTPERCTVLADDAAALEDLDRTEIEKSIADLRDDVSAARDDAEKETAEKALAIAEAKIAALELRYKLYVGAMGYRLEAVRPLEGPDIIIAQFAVPQFVYVDLDTGSVNFLPMGENDWGRFHGIACADFEYRKNLAPRRLRAGPPRYGNALAANGLCRIPEFGGTRRWGIRCDRTNRATSLNFET